MLGKESIGNRKWGTRYLIMGNDQISLGTTYALESTEKAK